MQYKAISKSQNILHMYILGITTFLSFADYRPSRNSRYCCRASGVTVYKRQRTNNTVPTNTDVRQDHCAIANPRPKADTHGALEFRRLEFDRDGGIAKCVAHIGNMYVV
jgi:hypothetical protein